MNTIYPHHLSGPNLRVRLAAVRTYPAGIFLNEFSTDVESSPDTIDFDQYTTITVCGDSVEVENHCGLYVAVHVVPDSREAKDLALLLDRNKGADEREAVYAFAQYPNGDTYAFSNGCIVQGRESKYNSEFLFHFKSAQPISNDVFRAACGEAVAA